MKDNKKIIGKIIVSSTLKLLHSVENITVYVEINKFKLSRFNDNDTGQQIRKLVLKVRLKKKLFSYQFKKKFSQKKLFVFLNRLHSVVPYSTEHIWNDQFGSDRNKF